MPHKTSTAPLSRRIGFGSVLVVTTLALLASAMPSADAASWKRKGKNPVASASPTSSPTSSPTATATAPSEPTTTTQSSPTASPSPTASTAPSPSPSATTATLRVTPGQSWAAVLATAQAGDTVLVANGTHPPQTLANKSYPNLTLVGESRTGTVLQGLKLDGVSGLRFKGFTIYTSTTYGASAVRMVNGTSYITLESLTIDAGAESGVELFNWAPAVAPHHISVLYSRIDGARYTGTNGRNIRIYGGNGGRSTWPHTIAIRFSTLLHASGDNIQIGGGRDIQIVGNRIADPQDNSDHNDGVQSYGSDNLLISRNRFSAAGALSSTDQAIMLGHHPTYADFRVTNTRVESNLIARWRGAGINVAGVNYLTVVNNTSTHNYGSTSSAPKASMYVTGGHDGSSNTGLRIFNNVLDRLGRSGPVELEDYNCIRSGGTGANDVSADPQFADTVDFRLGSTSPCRNRGLASDAPVHDIAGVVRQQPLDLGAWES